MSSSNSPSDRDRCAGWGIIFGGVLGAVPALAYGGRWWSAVLFLGVLGWMIGSLIDRARS